MQHQARLTDEEMAHQLVLLLGAGAEPLATSSPTPCTCC